tara:strand:- start:2084 stop:3106 length:1023 start_codon:yes stop_codon:yes gene_type:complete
MKKSQKMIFFIFKKILKIKILYKIKYLPMTDRKNAKKRQNFFCEKCLFECSKQSEFDRHLLTRKHKILTDTYQKTPKNALSEYVCECGKLYKHKQSLFNHRKRCLFLIQLDNNLDTSKNNITSKEINNLLNENKDIKALLIQQQEQLLEQQKQLGEILPKIGNNTINNTYNNTVNQEFNINIFLNEKCKDAINMDDFINKIELNLKNLDLTKNGGLNRGIANIFIENMNKLSIYERPLHCTDNKKEILYIKDNNNWNKDNNKSKLKDALKNLNKNHFKLVKEWLDSNPDFKEKEDKQYYFAKIIKECGCDIDCINDKELKKICNSTSIPFINNLDESNVE